MRCAGCAVYGAVGAVCGTCSIMTMVVIGYDRYNVIVKVGPADVCLHQI